MLGRIIFHHPLPIHGGAQSASGIRPFKMLEAFRRIGYEVDVVDGYSPQRARRIEEVKNNLIRGQRYAFVYSESSTMPTLLTDPHHLPVRPGLDFSFFATCKRYGVPIGLFYRDVYWKFPEYRRQVGFAKAEFAKLFYRYDLQKYRALIDKLYLPSLGMAEYVRPVPEHCFDELPPGHGVECPSKEANMSSPLRLLYVGGMGSHYRMQAAFKALERLEGVSLTVCTREAEWVDAKREYADSLTGRVTVVHKNGRDVEELYAECHIAMLFVEPQSYREFAMPFKLFEYLGHGKPVIASQGTLVGDFVERSGIGWTIPYDSQELARTLSLLLEEPHRIATRIEMVRQVAQEHTWEKRAIKVARDLDASAKAQHVSVAL